MESSKKLMQSAAASLLLMGAMTGCVIFSDKCCSSSSTQLGGELPELNWNPGSDWLNVRDFGAKGDGVSDDTASVQKAFAKIDDGVVIYFPPGTYIIKDELRIQKTNVTGSEKRMLGTGIYGHGRDTILRWEGAENGTMIRELGMLHNRVMGIILDGTNKAAVGYAHDNNNLFETHIYHQYLAFKNFRHYGVLSVNNDKDGLSTAEIAFVHTIFENCGIAISFTSFNDYDYTFDGCLFKDNAKLAVECLHGNFYIRNSRFENNAVDVEANPEHGSSIRRSVSVGSGVFLNFYNPVAPMTVEGCFVANWKGNAAITSKGAPLTLFDNAFKHASPAATPLHADSAQQILMGANRFDGPAKLCATELKQAVAVELPPTASVLDEHTSFIPAKAALPGRHFDVKRDFGATGDGRADDTAAIQKAIAAAKAFGNDAIAYLPTGRYRTTAPLEVTGSGYRLGGTGLFSRIIYAGKPDEHALQVRPDGNLTVENLSVERDGCAVKDHKVSWTGKGADIRQYPSGGGSRVRYHNIYVLGKYCHAPFILGLRLEDLAAHDTVLLENMEGNIHAINSGAATILAPISYEGTVWVKGKARGGCFGILTRLATLSEYSIYLEDNQSLIASDFYIEQALPKTVTLRGNAETAPGRITLSHPKLDITNSDVNTVSDCVRVDNYRGEVNFVATQLYPPKFPARITVEGTQTALGILGSFLYVKSFEFAPADLTVNMLGTSSSCEFNTAKFNAPGTRRDPAAARGALLDLRCLGELDQRLNYPELLKK